MQLKHQGKFLATANLLADSDSLDMSQSRASDPYSTCCSSTVL